MQSMKRFGPGVLATPANFITLGRLLLAIPTLLLIERDGSTWLTWGLWFFLCITDSVDGWLARRDGTTRSGAFLDPIADKVLTLGGFLALVWRGDLWWVPVAIMAAVKCGSRPTGWSRVRRASRCRPPGSASTRRSCRC